jgi:hypothetical protein
MHEVQLHLKFAAFTGKDRSGLRRAGGVLTLEGVNFIVAFLQPVVLVSVSGN